MEKLHHLMDGTTPFCIIQKQDQQDVLILIGTNSSHRQIKNIPRKSGPTAGKTVFDTISAVPFCQIRERGFSCIDDNELIRSIEITEHFTLEAEHLLTTLPHFDLEIEKEFTYTTSEEEYRQIIAEIVENEIGNGEGANFVVPRNGSGKIRDFNVAKALSVFRSLLADDFGSYWKYLFYDTNGYFIGSTPERHLLVKNSRVKMNPISGTFRKSEKHLRTKAFKADLLKFLNDPKEINELFMVVDEELKMMAKMCSEGGSIIGPILKEMSQLIHSEYLLSGKSDKDIFDLFRDSMFAATVVGSPVENACRIIAQYSSQSRRYYGSAMVLTGRDENGEDFLDSPITIRTAEIEKDGTFHLSVGATLVRDSKPDEELQETFSKGSAILASITATTESRCEPSQLLPTLYNDDDMLETLVKRNRSLSEFWFFEHNQQKSGETLERDLTVTLIHNGDDFIYMLNHILNRLGATTAIVDYREYDLSLDNSTITLLGPGPGNPTDDQNDKIAKNLSIANTLIAQQKKSVFICLGHQILCRVLGFSIYRKYTPLQGIQAEIDLFGRDELVGFYNTFAAKISPHQSNEQSCEYAYLRDPDDLVGIRTRSFIGFQFHPESILTQNGYAILYESLNHLMTESTQSQNQMFTNET